MRARGNSRTEDSNGICAYLPESPDGGASNLLRLDFELTGQSACPESKVVTSSAGLETR
jgi:hypothetical protein